MHSKLHDFSRFSCFLSTSLSNAFIQMRAAAAVFFFSFLFNFRFAFKNPRKKNIFAFNWLENGLRFVFLVIIEFLLTHSHRVDYGRQFQTTTTLQQKKNLTYLFFSHRFIKCNRTNENNEIEF